VLMMCGWERTLLKASLVDAGINLVASLILVFKFGVLGVALGTMIPTILIGWLWIVPITALFLKESIPAMLLSFTAGVHLPVTAALAVLLVLRWLAPLPVSAGFGGCIWRGALVMIALAATGWPFLKSIRKGAV
ncbi:MAG: hypothetical protein WCH43_08830, partial [Verrucomicrobiota bacterium]